MDNRVGVPLLVRPHLHPLRACAVLVVLVALLSASGMRQVLPGLKSVMRAPVPARLVGHDRTRTVRAVAYPGAGGLIPDRVSHVAAAPPRAPLARAADEPMPAGLAPAEASALGVSVAKRHRWTVLGGHGRHGAG